MRYTCLATRDNTRPTRYSSARQALFSGTRSRMLLAALLALAWASHTSGKDGPGSHVPRITFFDSQTAIAGLAFTSDQPRLREPATGGRWSLEGAPADMAIDARRGVFRWAKPRHGTYHFGICHTDSKGTERAPVLLRVVRQYVTEPRIVRSRYFDFVVPPALAEWMENTQAGRFADAYWRYERHLVGQTPNHGRQIVMYCPEIGGAHSGNPVEGGMGWDLDSVHGWKFCALVHEVAHNFHARTRIGRIIKDNPIDKFLHHGTELTQQSFAHYATAHPDALGLSPLAATAAVAMCHDFRNVRLRRRRGWEDALAKGTSTAELAESVAKYDAYGAWAGILVELSETHGANLLPDVLRLCRVDGLPATIYDLATSNEKKTTLLFCMFSAAAGSDMRPEFKRWGFTVDEKFYERMLPAVKAALKAAPRDEDAHGWKRCPHNGHYYRLAPWDMEWEDAESTARRLGGHLATIRSEAESRWIANRFSHRPTLWIGLRGATDGSPMRWADGTPIGYTRWARRRPTGPHEAVRFLMNRDRRWRGVAIGLRAHALIERLTPPPPDSAAPSKKSDKTVRPRAVPLQNPSFERRGAEGAVEGWSVLTHSGEAEVISDRQAAKGKRSICIASRDGADVSVVQNVTVLPHHLYRLRVRVRTRNVKHQKGWGVFVDIHRLRAQSRFLLGDNDWTTLEVVFDSLDRQTVRLNCRLGGRGQASGRVWFDDVRLTLLGSAFSKHAGLLDLRTLATDPKPDTPADNTHRP